MNRLYAWSAAWLVGLQLWADVVGPALVALGAPPEAAVPVAIALGWGTCRAVWPLTRSYDPVTNPRPDSRG